MSIVACPKCNRKISSKAVICNYCGCQLGDVTEHDLEVFKARKLRDRIYRLNMTSYAVITLFIAAFCWFWWESRGFAVMPSPGPFEPPRLPTEAHHGGVVLDLPPCPNRYRRSGCLKGEANRKTQASVSAGHQSGLAREIDCRRHACTFHLSWWT
jgi:hypothetical protein